MDYDVIIIGAGASGLTAAIAAARQGSSVLVIEQKEKAGKKILATGNGKCNFTNLYQSPECYRSDDSAFAGRVLSCFDVTRTVQFFKELGIYPKNREGYLYPNSEQAASILSVLLMECDRLGVKFRYGEKVIEIRKPFYTVITEEIPVAEQKTKKTALHGSSKSNDQIINKNNKDSLKYHSKKLILATGGCASPKLGSDGSGYQLAKNLGHSLIKPLPALVQLKSPDKYCKTVSGVRTHATVALYREGKELVREQGEVLFTDYGISGIPILQISRFAAKALDLGKKIVLSLDYLPELEKVELKQMLRQRMEQNPRKNLEEVLIGILNHKLSYVIILEARLAPDRAPGTLSEQELDRLLQNMKEFKMNINGTNSFENAQVCAGGVSTREVHETTMESKLLHGLYLAGELLDVDGTCGGYNLQWAWTTGYLAGTAAGKR